MKRLSQDASKAKTKPKKKRMQLKMMKMKTQHLQNAQKKNVSS